MPPRKTTKKKDKPRLKPEINIYSFPIDENDDFDFFPHMDKGKKGSFDNTQRMALKNGTYQPFMQMVEYETKLAKKNHNLISAFPKEFSASSHDQWDFSGMEVPKRTRMHGPSRLEVTNKQYEKSNVPLRPRYYHNPLQYFDHVLLADGYTNSFAGTVVDSYVDFVMPKTIKPVLKLRCPKDAGDKDTQQKLIKDNQEIIDKLEAVDRWYSDKGVKERDPYMDIPIQMKFKALITNTLTFGRSALVYENWKHLPTVTVGEEKFTGLPNAIKLMHPIDLGMVEIDEYSWKLGGMYVYNDRNYIPASQMLYLVHKYQSPMIGSNYYGYSIIQRAIDPFRLLRRIFARNYQQFIRTSYSGMGAFIFDSTQYPDDVRKKIRTSIRNSYVAGEVAIIDYANIKDFMFQEFKIHPEIQGLQALQEQLIKVIIGVTGMPQSLIFDEAAATRATLVGRIVSFLNNQIQSVRTEFAEQFSSQWYMKVFRTLYAKEEDLLEKFYIDCEFEEMELETKLEKIDRLLAETSLNPMTDEYIGEQLNDSDYLEHVDTEKRDEQAKMGPMGSMGGGGKPGGKGIFSVTDSATGKVAKVSQQ